MSDYIHNQSRLVRRAIDLNGVTVDHKNDTLHFKGPLGEAVLRVDASIDVKIDEDGMRIYAKQGYDEAKALSGTLAANARNAIHGLTKGFEKKMILKGVGYRAKLDSKTKMTFTLGKSHEDVVHAPEGITFDVPVPTEVIVRGTNKQMVGQVSADICALRPVEPYKGKGIGLEGATFKRKEVKKKGS